MTDTRDNISIKYYILSTSRIELRIRSYIVYVQCIMFSSLRIIYTVFGVRVLGIVWNGGTWLSVHIMYSYDTDRP